MRAKLWSPADWSPEAMPSRVEIVEAIEDPDMTREELEDYYGPAYAAGLYAQPEDP